MKKTLLFSFLIFGAAPLQADVIYTDFGGTPTFITGSGVTVTGSGSDYSTAFAFLMPFDSDYLVTAIDFVASLNSGDNLISATIYQDASGSPGAEVYSTGAISDELGTGDDPAEIAFSVAAGPVLNAGDTYWLSLDGSPSSSIFWNYNGNYTSGQVSTFQNSAWSQGSPYPLGAFEIDGTEAPEPITVLSFLSGIAAILYGQRRLTARARQI